MARIAVRCYIASDYFPNYTCSVILESIKGARSIAQASPLASRPNSYGAAIERALSMIKGVRVDTRREDIGRAMSAYYWFLHDSLSRSRHLETCAEFCIDKHRAIDG